MLANPSQSIETKPTLSRTIFGAILLFATLAHVMADMYVPSLPSITTALASNVPTIQLTLSVFMFGYSIGHLIYGPLSDQIGRRKPMLFGIWLSIMGSLLCYLALTVAVLMIGRLLQGLGVAVCNSVGRSIIRDLLSGNHLAKVSSHLGMVMVFVIALAPTLGGYIQYYFDWRMVFLVLTAYSLFIWLYLWKVLPETNQYLNPDAMKINIVFRNYLTLLMSKTFLGYSLCVSFAYAGIIAYVTYSPFLFETILNLTPPEYGWLSFFIGFSIFVSFFLNSKYVMKKGFEKMISIGNKLMLLGGMTMLVLACLGWMNVFVILVPVMLYCVGAGFTFSNGFAGASHPFPKIAGSVGALFGCLQIMGGALTSSLMAGFHVSNQIPLAIVFTILGILSLICFKKLACSYGE